MSLPEEFVSLHPYFKVHPGKLEEAKALLPAFVEKTKTEARMLFYGFTLNGDQVFCREAYDSAEGVLAHLSNVGDLLAAMLQLAELVRIEVHGPEAELEKLRGPLENLKPAWFIHQCGAINNARSDR
jgi:quinol monooxygenase YgiN